MIGLRLVAVMVLCSLVPGLSAAEPAIKPEEGRPQVLWQDAKEVAGKTAYVSGKVLAVRKAGKIAFLDFDEQKPARFTAVIFDDSIQNFPTPPKELYAGKNVRLSGMVSMYKGAPEIRLTKPEQVEVISELPASSSTSAGKPAVQAAARAAGKPGELVVAEYNVMNLFDDYDDPYRNDEGTPAKPRSELEHLAASIRQLNADVIAMEEVENRDYLQRFIDVFLPDMGYDNVVLFEGNDMRGIDVALVSRVPVGAVTSHRHLRFPGPDGKPMGFMRDVLSVTLEPAGAPPLEAWVVHLKSNADGRETAEPLRLAEAKKLRELLDDELAAKPDVRLILMGDFNDTPECQTVKTIIGSGPGALWSAATDLKDPEPITYNQGDFRSMIDFMLCSPAMARVYEKGSFHIQHGTVETSGSDHNPIEARFQLK